MPTYEYECKSCGHILELFEPITASKVKKCPMCHGRAERLLGTGGAIIFKGSGFYQTDYRSKDYLAKAKKEGAGKETPHKKGTDPS